MNSKRRRYIPDWPQGIPRSRARLSRLMVVLGAAILLTVLGARMRPIGGSNIVTAPTPVRTATLAASGTPRGTPPVTLEQRADGWYLTRPEAWPLVEVDRIIDGDTLDVRAAQTVLRVRVFGIDTPERGQRCFDEATARLTSLAGRSVRLVADARQQDAFGRELRYVFTPEGRSLDAALLDAGLARAWREDGRLRDILIGIEVSAHGARRGCLWAG
jgi:endonuclease YncB( thermonuclease family)